MNGNDFGPHDSKAIRWLVTASGLTLLGICGIGVFLYARTIRYTTNAPGDGGPDFSGYGAAAFSLLGILALFLFSALSFGATQFARRANPHCAPLFRRVLAVLDLLLLTPPGAFIAYALWINLKPR